MPNQLLVRLSDPEESVKDIMDQPGLGVNEESTFPNFFDAFTKLTELAEL